MGLTVDLGINPEQIIIAGESEGEFTLATGLKLKEEGNMTLVRGLYALVHTLWNLALPENCRWKTMEFFLSCITIRGQWRMGSKSWRKGTPLPGLDLQMKIRLKD